MTKPKHGRTKTPEFWVWWAMHQRCSNPNNPSYPNYGGRGVRVCRAWRSFAVFLRDMGERPNSGFTLERKNTNKGYPPKNCCWATRAAQQRNVRRNLWFTYRGRKVLAPDLAKLAGMSAATMRYRLKHWSVQRALAEPVQERRRG